ncbi:rho GTPase-activating protein 22 isoform X2 [Gadus morhua]|nr:rho GTPase-activating protein 22-like isoform X2 [Gadus morhua]XP_030234189.1 rho GTPase-activating protein 22-like isoform X2 [Gadus morhua]XP_030234190.1 rho GTPase-activating protein 22-like isoform X2 [Gadus morhua]XP_030234191.1 rho GTPase-activating protein 22-like isoform X2 [Gadus morhua]XP_030234193.1 rho GTPase-activating protein 22-like isoform X2 [Gadus morhua]XP_030234194.1 rho GTPase-activating protein 22-like isoform X2 [Gadus morhua]
MVLGELSRLSRPCSPLDQERALKAGWLKRQRSIMKNWQLRWFVLRPEALYFYKDQEEAKAQGCIPLQASQVNELPANQDEPGRHLFEIVPGNGGEKDRTGVSHESFMLMANSQSDMEDWVRSIRRAVWSRLGGGVFGQHLEETMLCESQCDPQRLVPVLVEQCVSLIRQCGLQEEGLFRSPGPTNHVRELQDAFDRGEKPKFDSTTDVHTVASLLKLYIRELPEPVIPFSKYTQFLSCAQLLNKDRGLGIVELSKQVKALPQVNYNLLKYVCRFLDEVQSHSNENKMSVQNLATVFGPNILRPRVEDAVTMMEGSSQVQHLMTVLISEHACLYQGEEKEAEQEPKAPTKTQSSPGPRGRVEWVSQGNNTPRTSPTLALDPNTSKDQSQESSTLSVDGKHVTESTSQTQEDGEEGKPEEKPTEKTEGKAGIKSDGKPGNGMAVSPSKQSKALPSWRTSFKAGGAGSGAPRGKMGGSAGDVSAASGSNWLMNGLSSLRAHRRTSSSGERLKDSTLSLKDTPLFLKDTALSPKDPQKNSLGDSLHSPASSPLAHRSLGQSHRLSAYDNVAPSSLSLPSDTSTIWTSYEISLTDPEDGDQGSKPVPVKSLDMVTQSSTPLDPGADITRGGGEDADVKEDGKGLGTDEDLAKLLSNLKQELKMQQISYESCIRKLEESCSRYQCQVGSLEEELDQEKKKLHMLEIRLRNSERAHQDAESRNVLLQKEMEDFFQTLGDLTTGTARTS